MLRSTARYQHRGSPIPQYVMPLMIELLSCLPAPLSTPVRKVQAHKAHAQYIPSALEASLLHSNLCPLGYNGVTMDEQLIMNDGKTLA